MEKREAGELANQLRIKNGLSWEDLASAISRPPVWTVAAILGFHPIPADQARALGELLGLDDDAVTAMQRQPSRTADDSIRSDPTIYRFYELLQVYGPALKELIHEEFGDGIMSAINCNVELGRVAHPDGDRVRVTIEGKFLAYQW
ncbi:MULTISPECIES: cyanase [unclassified Cryobacterium]|uniref:cyanase n=1 Tax=unclassified Cryobacterium TaxID=2649013 RepID=UPI00106D1D34|nr:MULTISPECIES: cyanase [unclassified Cryobacterium]TFC51085.1 cyanase [Cryobacterium sp. TMB3-1-2]TFC74431.1 cyanase [Cryobacterium sp. TMB3-15]TFC79944.1 cyanase [Cryobacterium sp. TMB3-10]TFD41845.1 cyanase [Cryobacterium sp. TMB3-12]